MDKRNTYILYLVIIIVLSLLIGILGFMWIGGQSFFRALNNASLMLSTMSVGEIVDTVQSRAWITLYALFCGLFFIIIIPFVISIALRMNGVDV